MCLLKASTLGALAWEDVTNSFHNLGALKKNVLLIILVLGSGSISWFITPTWGSAHFLDGRVVATLGSDSGGIMT